eukprot:2832746-Rhodomonas_salina.1
MCSSTSRAVARPECRSTTDSSSYRYSDGQVSQWDLLVLLLLVPLTTTGTGTGNRLGSVPSRASQSPENKATFLVVLVLVVVVLLLRFIFQVEASVPTPRPGPIPDPGRNLDPPGLGTYGLPEPGDRQALNSLPGIPSRRTGHPAKNSGSEGHDFPFRQGDTSASRQSHAMVTGTSAARAQPVTVTISELGALFAGTSSSTTSTRVVPGYRRD